MNVPVAAAAEPAEEEDATIEVLLVMRVVLDIIEVRATVEVVEEGDSMLLALDAGQLPGMH